MHTILVQTKDSRSTGCQKYFYSFIASFYLVSLLRWRGFHGTQELRLIGHLIKMTSNLVECPFIKTFYMELNKKANIFII